MYFNNILQIKEKINLDNDEEEHFVGPLLLFKKCVKYLNDYLVSKKLDGKNKNICKLFCIGYIRAFCYKFINLIDLSSRKLGDMNKIIQEINNSKSVSKIISFYILKILYNNNKKNVDIFAEPEFIKKYELKKYSNFTNIDISKNPFTYYCSNPKVKEIYEQLNKTLEDFGKNDYEKVKIDELKQSKTEIDIFYFSTNNLILSKLRNVNFIGSKIYKNFYNNVCIPLFENNDKIFKAIKVLYNPSKYKDLREEFFFNGDNLNIIFHSYRYFINEINSNSQDSIYSIFYSNYSDINKINSFFIREMISKIFLYIIYIQKY